MNELEEMIQQLDKALAELKSRPYFQIEAALKKAAETRKALKAISDDWAAAAETHMRTAVESRTNGSAARFEAKAEVYETCSKAIKKLLE